MWSEKAKKGVTDKAKRPVWILFNGGPGAATIWLHMGAFGPKMVKMESNGLATPPPYTYVDNPNCLLDTGDLRAPGPYGFDKAAWARAQGVYARHFGGDAEHFRWSSGH